jgi:hypothetical protein
MKGVSWATIKVLLLNFAGVKTADRERDPPKEDEKQENQEDQPAENPRDDGIKKLGFFQEDTFYLKKGSHGAIFTHFKNFYVHRI